MVCALPEHLKSLPQAPVVVFVTAHPGHALEAFELAALDYLTKPVRLERLQAALQKRSAISAPCMDQRPMRRLNGMPTRC